MVVSVDRLPRAVPSAWQLARRPEGWLELRRPWEAARDLDPLAEHADWAGPVKLAQGCGRVEQRVEFFLGGTGETPLADEESARDAAALTDELIRLGCSLGGPGPDGWTPPPVEHVVGWLNEAGYETAIDKDSNIRLTLKRVGCDGEVRGRCTDGRLRFVLPLGSWTDLDATAEQAMRRLAGWVNAHSRLVRVAVIAEGNTRRFEAQADLTGLPTGGDAGTMRERLWGEMVRLAAKGLELALRQLGLELPLLADPRHRDLAELLLARRA
jgi:hypothetical protein